MWVWLAWQRLSFPVPVLLKRFIAARLVFIFGIAAPMSVDFLVRRLDG